MTTAHVEKFAELVAKDPALLAKLGLDKVNAAAAEASAAAFITNAVKEASALGLQFTEEEAQNFMMAAAAKAAASGELSDTQLEAVPGGKGDQRNAAQKYADEQAALRWIHHQNKTPEQRHREAMNAQYGGWWMLR